MLFSQKSFIGVEGAWGVSLIDLWKCEVAKIPFPGLISMHILFHSGWIEERINAYMINASIVSRLVQTLSKQIMKICSSHFEIWCYFLLNPVAARSSEGAVSPVIFKGLGGDEEVVA